MNYTKTGFSYILWGIYTLLICTLLTLGVMGITADIGMMNMPYRILSAGIFFLLLFGISALCYSLFGQFLCKKRFYSPDWTSIELIAVTTVFLFMLAFDIKNIMFSIVSETSILTGDSRYFTTAMLTEENTGIVWMAHGASYVFTVLLRGMCMLFGNIDMAVVLLQVILQLIAVAYAYFAVRNLLGRLAAFVTVIAMAVIPVFTDKLSNQTAEMVLLCSVTVVLFYLSLLIKLINRAKIKKFAWSIAFLCYGILLAGCIYLDAVGLVMLLVSVAAILMLRRTKTDEEVRKPLICNRAIQVLFVIIGACAGVAGMCGARAYLMQMSYSQAFFEYVNIYVTNWQGLEGLAYFIQDMKEPLHAVAYFLAAFLIAGFWFVKQDKTSLVILYFVGTTVLQFVEHDGVLYDSVSKFGIVLLVAMAIQMISDYRIQKYELAEMEEAEQEVDAEVTSNQEEAGLESIEREQQAVSENKTAEIQFIENPLPLPKKHVPKTMDYDIEVDDNDDYDLQD